MTFPSKIETWARQKASAHRLRTFVEACEAEGIATLPVKGVLSASTLYGDCAERPLTDVDVRVAPRDVQRVARVCRVRGWPIVQHMRSYANLVTMIDGVSIDVEAHVGPPGLCTLPVATMIARAQFGHALGFRCREADFTDHAVLLVVNAFKDKFVGAFEWAVRDLERIPLARAFDADLLARRLRDTHAHTLGWITATWMVETRGAKVWTQVAKALGPPPRARYARVFAWAMRRDESFASRVITRLASDSPIERAHALARAALWEVEVVASTFGPTPYERGNIPYAVRAAPDRGRS